MEEYILISLKWGLRKCTSASPPKTAKGKQLSSHITVWPTAEANWIWCTLSTNKAMQSDELWLISQLRLLLESTQSHVDSAGIKAVACNCLLFKPLWLFITQLILQCWNGCILGCLFSSSVQFHLNKNVSGRDSQSGLILHFYTLSYQTILPLFFFLFTWASITNIRAPVPLKIIS